MAGATVRAFAKNNFSEYWLMRGNNFTPIRAALGQWRSRAFRFYSSLSPHHGRVVGGGRNLQRFKSLFGLAGAVVPVFYCGYLVYYFMDVGGSVQGVQDVGLGPTVIGLGVVSLLFCIPLVLKLVRLFSGPRSPGPRRDAPDADDDDDGGAAADAIIARYMARQAAEAEAQSKTQPSTSFARPAQKSSGPAKPSFGRKT